MQTPDRPGLRRACGIAGIAYFALFAATFSTGVGAHLYGQDTPAAVASWSSGHAALLQGFVLFGLVGDWLYVLFAFLLIASVGDRSVSAWIACVGIAAAETVNAVIRGLQYSLPQLAGLPGGDSLAQAAVVLQTSLVFSVYPLPFAIGWGAIGYVLVRGRGVLRVFGAFAMTLAVVYAISFSLRQLDPLLVIQRYWKRGTSHVTRQYCIPYRSETAMVDDGVWPSRESERQ
jgi:hypothetical protein